MTWFSTSLIQLKSKLDNMGTAVGRSEPCLSERMCRPISFSGEHPRPVCLGWSDQGHEGRSSVRDEQLPLSIQRSQTMGLGHLLGRLQGTFHQKEAPGGDPGHTGRSLSPRWPGSTWGFPQESGTKSPWRVKSGLLFQSYCPPTSLLLI